MVSVDSLPVPTSRQKRIATTILPLSDETPSFRITSGIKSYNHQYANIYFIRLQKLRPFVEKRASRRWKNVSGNPALVPRVLEVVKSQLCYVVGTVYMDMPLKPNVLEDIARDQTIPPPPPLAKFNSPNDSVMLEDESGRIKLVGEPIKNAQLVTGVIIGALGVETPNGEFEAVDIVYAGLAPQMQMDGIENEEKMEVDEFPADVPQSQPSPSDEWVAMVSGLDVGSPSSPDAQIQLLVEYLLGESNGSEIQVLPRQISRLIIAGNSLPPVSTSDVEIEKKPRRYGYDFASFSPHPTVSLSSHLLDLAQAMPIHILPGPADPSGVILPQQPFPRAMFGAVSGFSSFTCETNPTYIHIGSCDDDDESNKPQPDITRTFLINSGQPLNDMFKYLPSPPATRLSLAESTLRWRHIAPTAPDTLWCHPYFDGDPFIIKETPDIYILGDQPKLQTKLVVDREGGKKCRIILVPRFAETGMVVLVNLRTLDVRSVQFTAAGMSGALEQS